MKRRIEDLSIRGEAVAGLVSVPGPPGGGQNSLSQTHYVQRGSATTITGLGGRPASSGGALGGGGPTVTPVPGIVPVAAASQAVQGGPQGAQEHTPPQANPGKQGSREQVNKPN